MPSPSKKRKLNHNIQSTGPASRGLEYFFSKQRQNGTESSKNSENKASICSNAELTDEELARKLQAEWNQEVAGGQVGIDQGHATLGEQDEKVKDPASPSPAPKSRRTTDLAISLTKPVPLSGKAKGILSLQSAGMDEDTTSTSIPLDESPLTFEPAKYLPQLQEHWAADGGDASYALLTRCFILINGTTSRIKIVDTLVNCLRVLIEGDPSALLPAVCLLLLSPNALLTPLGLACHQLNIASVYIHGTWTRWFCHLQSPAERLWPG